MGISEVGIGLVTGGGVVGTPSHGFSKVGGIREYWHGSDVQVTRDVGSHLELHLDPFVHVDEQLLEGVGVVPVLVLDVGGTFGEGNIKHEVTRIVINAWVPRGRSWMI